jgi:hypothetical protein
MKSARGSLGIVTTMALVLFAAAKGAAQTAEESAEFDSPSGELTPTIFPLEPEFDSSPGWSIGLEAYGGLAVLSTEDGGHAHAILGGLSRFQLGYFQLGGFIESTDGGENHWSAIGGFAGAFIPYRHWVDFEFTAGLAARRYREEAVRYGPDGYEATSPALLLRAGFSDRALDDLFGVRLGGHLTAMIDLERHERPWTYTAETSDGEVRTVTGESAVGGFSVGIGLTAGFDIGRKPPRPAEQRTFRASR